LTPVEVTQGDSPVILGLPHGGTWLPDGVAARLDANGRKLADTDWHIDRLYEGLLPGVTVVRATFHRYLIDANRDPAGVSLYPGQNTTSLCPVTDFDGLPIWEEGQEPSQDEILSRRDRFHAPYHAALEDQVQRVRARHGAASVTQFELLPRPPECENKPLVWPYWPTKFRTSSSHDEGCQRDWSIATKEFIGGDGEMTGKLRSLKCVRLDWQGGKMTEIPGSEFEIKADLVFLAMGFTSPVASVLDGFGVAKDARGNASATTDGTGSYATSVGKVFAAGDMRRGQSLVVWAIREGRQCARAVDEFLMGRSLLPR
jgi:hypothetical protein